ncbi:MAG TPA: DNA primase [Anaerolineales bacterium]|nr:DNA primase [Anaerolineales bacterium]
MNNIEEIKARIDAVDLIGETVQLRRSGRSYSGFCPFHDNKRTPAFAVFPESGTWRCFGQCNDGGDIFKFVMKKEGWDFSEALRYLAERAGVQLRTFTPAQEAQREENERLRELLEDAVVFFRHQLMKTGAGAPALKYLRDRSLGDETIETWGLGYAPASYDTGLHHFTERGYAVADMLAAGMVTERDGGGVYDRFRDRITFAIRDDRGRMTGFGARTLDPAGIPKYLNSPQTVLFDKGGLLYGLDRAGRSIRQEEMAVVVEGYMDVIALHQAGFANAVSPMGTALTEAQLQLLKRRTKKMILALDADAAGNRATLRGLELARETFDRETEVAFDARGLLRQESRLKADIRIAMLPEGQDPDDVVNRDPDEWRRIIATARPIVAHVMEAVSTGRDLDDPKIKTEIAAQIMPLINDLPDAFERDTYLQRLARFLKVDERTLFGDPRTGPRPAGPRYRAGRASRGTVEKVHPDREPPGLPVGSTQALEVFCLGVLMRSPNFIFRLDRSLQKAGLGRLAPHDFQDTGHQSLARAILEAVDQDFDVPQHVLFGSLPLNLLDQADQVLADTANLPEHDGRLLEHLIKRVIDLRRRNINQNLSHLRFMMEDAQETGDARMADYQQTMKQHILALNQLDQALRKTHDRTILNG